MVSGNERLVATRTPLEEILFDPKKIYDRDDFCFRLSTYYEMMLSVTGKNGENANEDQMYEMLAVLNLIHWAEEMPLGSLIGHETDAEGETRPYVILPKAKYLM